jgi:protein phosphatase 1 regulatory subunit 37
LPVVEWSLVHSTSVEAQSDLEGPEPKRQQNRCSRPAESGASASKQISLGIKGICAYIIRQKLNNTLETLDLSQNPCCGPILDGVCSLLLEAYIDRADVVVFSQVIALKAALAVNTSLKRIYLGFTGMNTDGAVVMAEGLHEARHILHIDLSENPAIGSDGASALSVGIRANSTIRCLDLTLDHLDPAQAELAQSLMQCCIRNTESAIAARNGNTSEAVKNSMWAPIRDSHLVRQAKDHEERQQFEAVRKTVDTPFGLARSEVYTLDPTAVLKATEEVAQYLRGFNQKHKDQKVDTTEQQRAVGAVEQAKALLERVGDLIQETEDPSRMQRLLSANDIVTPLVVDAEVILAGSQRRKVTPLQINPISKPDASSLRLPSDSAIRPRRHMRLPSHELSSPNFSLTNSDDDDSDAEELPNGGPSEPVPKPTLAITTLPFVKKKPIPLAGLNLGALNSRASQDNLEADDGGTKNAEQSPPLPSPLERVNKDWLEEEGEIFRKGFKLGVAQEIEERDDKLESGNTLKQKVRKLMRLVVDFKER